MACLNPVCRTGETGIRYDFSNTVNRCLFCLDEKIAFAGKHDLMQVKEKGITGGLCLQAMMDVWFWDGNERAENDTFLTICFIEEIEDFSRLA